MSQPQNRPVPRAKQADSETDMTDAEPVAQRTRERRYQRALEGWLASGMRTQAHERRRAMTNRQREGDKPAGWSP
jgi:hypothetical protein